MEDKIKEIFVSEKLQLIDYPNTIEKLKVLFESHEAKYMKVTQAHIVDQDVLISELTKERDELKEAWEDSEFVATFNFKSQSKQISDLKAQVERLREGMKKIQTMKKLSEDEDYEYVYNRCWHISDKLLTEGSKEF